MLVLMLRETTANTHHLGLGKKTTSLATNVAHRTGFPDSTAAFKPAAMASAMRRILASCIRFIRCSAGVATRSFIDGAADLAGAVGIFECIIKSFPYLSMVQLW
jgi:hypothetical protein